MKTAILALTVLALAAVAGADKQAAEPYRSPGKLGAAVAIEGKAVYQTASGQALRLPLVLTLGLPASALRIEIAPGDNLHVDAARSVQTMSDVSAGRLELAPLTVTPMRDGRHYLGITVFATQGGRERFRSFAIPVEAGDVGRARAAKAMRIETDADGRRVHVLPAREID